MGDQVKDHIIVDLDGTLANDAHRNHLLQVSPRKWKEYFSLCRGDTPHKDIIEIVRTLAYNYENFVVILTGRCISTEKDTVEWLHENRVPFDQLIMRPLNDRTDDHVLKPRIARDIGLTPDRVLAVMEDRQRVVEAWRAAGYRCLQVAPGDF